VKLYIISSGGELSLVEKKEISLTDDVEILPSIDLMDRIENYWLEKIDIDDDDYLYIKKEKNHIVIGKVEINFIE